MKRFHLTTSSLLICFAETALADQCYVTTGTESPSTRAETISASLTPEQIAAAAEDMRILDNGNVIELSGNVEIATPTERIAADNAVINKRDNSISTSGRLSLESDTIAISGADAKIDQATNSMQVNQAEFTLKSKANTLHGEATELTQKNTNRLVMKKASLTSCPPGSKPAWQLKLNKISVNNDSERATATGVQLRFMDTPIFYLPWINFSISDRRKTGFLYPSIGNDNSNGFEFELPWYWNILPQADATFTLNHMEKRGTQLQTDWRYLQKKGYWALGTEQIDDRKYGGNRSAYSFNYNGEPADRWLGNINVSGISDNDYYSDVRQSFELSSLSHLERLGELTYQGESQRFRIRVQTFQTIDNTIEEADRPYRRLPQLSLSGPLYRASEGWSLSHRSELVYFDHDSLISGTRIDSRPRLEWPLEGQSWFFKPSVSLWHTAYLLNDEDMQDQSRTLAVSSIDTGLYFEKNLESNGDILTLEPRLFYLNTPYKNQNNLPVFDSTLFDFNFSQLFRENRFSSADRVGDANQVTVALTSRQMKPDTGAERWRASVGQIFYLDNRDVTLSDDEPRISTASDLVTEFSAKLNDHWSATAALQWDTSASNSKRDTVRLAYRGQNKRIFNFTHSLERDSHEQVETSAYWPLNDQWRLGSQWRYSLSDKYSQEAIAALEYESCCWGLRLYAGRISTGPDEIPRDSVNFQLIFKGLSSLGSDIDQSLENAILGYKRDDN